MNDEIAICEQISIRDAGKDEHWLQDQIWNNPSFLGLGELEPIRKEKRQSSGGRLDILLGNPEDDSRYAVEVMLGETDETHIVRTIEYWLRERRQHPTKHEFDQHLQLLLSNCGQRITIPQDVCARHSLEPGTPI